MAKVLIVDDSAVGRNAIAQSLKEDNYEVIYGANGKEAFDQSQKEKPDCIVSDINMPIMDGLGLLAELKKVGSAIPIIMVTGDITEGTRTQCVELGAHAVLKKPLVGKNTEIRDAVKNVLAGKK